MQNSLSYKLLNALMFFIGWFFCVTNAARGRPLLGLSISLFIVGIHLVFIKNKLKEFLLIVASVIAGFCVETMLIKFYVLRYASPNAVWPGYAPFWVLGLYALFATTINHSLAWLRPLQFVAALFGFLGAILSYSAGEYLGAVEFVIPRGGSVMAVGIFWFVLMPMLYLLNEILTYYLKES